MKVFTKVCTPDEIDTFIEETSDAQDTELEDIELIPHAWQKGMHSVVKNIGWAIQQPNCYDRKTITKYMVVLSYT